MVYHQHVYKINTNDFIIFNSWSKIIRKHVTWLQILVYQ